MKAYLDLLRHVVEHGVRKPTRCVLKSTGGPVDAISVFAPPPFRWELGEGFPLVTTKRVDFDAVAAELLWFLSGSTNVRDLHEHGVRIWDAWADESGDLGPIYGRQFRRIVHRDGPHDELHIDQIAELVGDIRRVAESPRDESARRLVLSAWNVGEIHRMALAPCHAFSQFDVTDGRLSCHLYQRSADLFLGVPYNIASYALLTHMLAHVTGLKPGSLTISYGDAHVYVNHLGRVEEQLGRAPRPSPRLAMRYLVDDIDDFTLDAFALLDYDPHPALRGEVAV